MSKARKIFTVFTGVLFISIFLTTIAWSCVSSNLMIEKSGPDCVVPGDNITYTICVWNQGSGVVEDVMISDTIPAGTTFVSASGDYTGPDPDCVVWSLGSIAADKVCVTLTVRVDPDFDISVETDPNQNLTRVPSVRNRACGFTGSCSETNCSAYVLTEVKATCDGEVLGCRMTGGGNDTAGLDSVTLGWDGTFASKTPRGRGASALNDYTFGGQAGASTALPPQPKGEWTHHQQKGPDGSFVFHAGTASAPEGTEINMIVCSDPGFCNPARPAPAKQIDFEGVGSFKNMKHPAAIVEAAVVEGVSLHRFNVHVEDLGEPGKEGQHTTVDSPLCPLEGSDGLSGDLAECDCPDFYRITIYADEAPLEEQGDEDVIYQVEGYIDGGNLQIHPLTGKDTH
jgi:uncharacterized repeat protein (TIGR01451 family)